MSMGTDDRGGKTIFAPMPATGQARPQPAAAPDDGLADAAPAPMSDEDFVQPPLDPAQDRLAAAATPLLSLISGVRSGRFVMPMPTLHRLAVDLADGFDRRLRQMNMDAESIRRARYGLFATVDDIAQNIPGAATEAAQWARRSLVVRAFGENIGGDRFWLLLQDMLGRPAEYVALIELYHACLAAGFEGRYRISPDGRRQLHGIMASAYAALPQVRDLSQTDISPQWRGTTTPMTQVGSAPLLLVAGIGSFLLLLITTLIFYLILSQTGQPSLDALSHLNPDRPLRLSRSARTEATADNAQAGRLRRFLAPEIAQKLVVVEQDANSVRVRTTVGQLFASASDKLEDRAQALFSRIAAAIDAEPGLVRVEGHADSDAVATLDFPDNVALSEARAKAVADLTRGLLRDQDRVSAQGFGDSRPIASNDSSAGKSLNRRVEIVLVTTENP